MLVPAPLATLSNLSIVQKWKELKLKTCISEPFSLEANIARLQIPWYLQEGEHFMPFR